MSKFNLLSNLWGASAAAAAASLPNPSAEPAGTPAPLPSPNPPAPAASEDGTVDVVAADQARAAVAQARSEGFQAATDRFAAVMASDAGKSNPAMAVFMLTKTQASADDIVKELGGMPAPAPAAAAPAPAPAAITTPLEQTPKVDLGTPGAAANDGSGDDKVDTNKLWDQVQGVGATTGHNPMTQGGMPAPAAAARTLPFGG